MEVVPVCWITLVLFLRAAAFDGDGKDLTQEDFEALQNNLVVLKNKIDDGFEPNGEPIHILGKSFTGTLTKYTRGDQCFQLLTLDLRDTSVQDSVKISCDVVVAETEMSTEGIKIGGMVKEGYSKSCYYAHKKAGCVHRYYGTEPVDNMDLSLTGSFCADLTKGEDVASPTSDTNVNSDQPSTSGSSNKKQAQEDRHIFDGDGKDLTDEDFEALKNKLVVLKNKIDDGFDPSGDPINIKGKRFTATLTKYTRGDQCFQLLTIDLRDENFQDSVKISCDVEVSDTEMSTEGIKIGGMVKEGYSKSVYYAHQKGECVHRYYGSDPLDNMDIPLSGASCSDLNKGENVGTTSGSHTSVSVSVIDEGSAGPSSSGYKMESEEDTHTTSGSSTSVSLIDEGSAGPSSSGYKMQSEENTRRFDGDGKDMTRKDFKALSKNFVVLKNKVDDGFEPDGDPIDIDGRSFTATLTTYTRGDDCFQLFTLYPNDGDYQDSVKISCDVEVSDTDMTSSGIQIEGIIKEGFSYSMFYATGNKECVHRYYGSEAVENQDFPLSGVACAVMTEGQTVSTRRRSHRSRSNSKSNRPSTSSSSTGSSKKIRSQDNRHIFDGDGKDMTDEDFEALKNKLVVLKNKIDDGFDRTEDPIHILGRSFTATLTKYTRGDQCFQLLTLDLREGSFQDSVKISCDAEVSDSDMSSTGIKIGGVVKEGNSKSFYYAMGDGRCVHRFYGTEPIDNMDLSLSGASCTDLAGGKNVVTKKGSPSSVTSVTIATPSISGSGSSNKKQSEENRHIFDGDGMALIEEDFETLKNNWVVLKNKIDDGFTANGQPIEIQGTSFTGTLTKYTRGDKCFQLLTLVLKEESSVQDSVKISCDVQVSNTDMSSTGISIEKIIEEGSSTVVHSVYYTVGNGQFVHRYYSSEPMKNFDLAFYSADSVDPNKVLTEGKNKAIKHVQSQENRHVFDGDGVDLTDKDFDTLKHNLVVLKNKVDDGFVQDGDPKDIKGMKYDAILTKYKRGNQCFQLLTIDLLSDNFQDSVKLSCDLEVTDTDMKATGIRIGGVVVEYPADRCFVFITEGSHCVKRNYYPILRSGYDSEISGAGCAGIIDLLSGKGGKGSGSKEETQAQSTTHPEEHTDNSHGSEEKKTNQENQSTQQKSEPSPSQLAAIIDKVKASGSQHKPSGNGGSGKTSEGRRMTSDDDMISEYDNEAKSKPPKKKETAPKHVPAKPAKTTENVRMTEDEEFN